MPKVTVMMPALNHSIETLDAIKNQIPFWPLEKQAQYADNICRVSVNNPEMLSDLVPESFSDLSQWNATSFGNLAYIALNTKSKFMRDYATGILKITRKHWRK